MGTADDEDRWAPLVEPFIDGHYGSARGRVRTRVIDAQLGDHLAPPPAELVDVGGGAGDQSLPLARAGYRVTIVDPSPAMLARARQRVAEAGEEVAARVNLVEASGEAAPEVLGGRRFDAVLCHGVVPYLNDPDPLLDALVRLAEPGGIVSVLAKNVRTLAVRPAFAGDWAAALEAYDATREINALGLDTRGDDVEALAAALSDRGVEPLAWYGVRLFTEIWRAERSDGGPAADEPSDEVIAVELEAGRRDPYRQLSRLFHLIGRRR